MARADKQSSLYWLDDVRAQVLARSNEGDREDGDGRASPRVLQQLARRYFDLLWRSRPDLAPNEWRLVCDALNGGWLLDETEHVIPARSLVYTEVADAIRINGLDRKWDADASRLLPRLLALTDAEAEAVLDVVRIFWRRDDDAVPGEPSWREPK